MAYNINFWKNLATSTPVPKPVSSDAELALHKAN